MEIGIILISALVIGLAVYFVIKGADVRLVLFLAGLSLSFIALKPWIIFDTFQKVIGDGKIIGPICTAMGFAFVVRETGCDKEMVRLLVQPIKKIKWLLLPGGCIIGFLTNMAITSQTASAAAAVGPVLMPLMIAAGFHPIIAGAALVLGCSAGGNLFNPGEPDIVAIQINTNGIIGDILQRTVAPELIGFLVAVTFFVFFSRKEPEEKIESEAVFEVQEETRPNIIKALLPPLPIILLFMTQPKFNLFPPLLKLYPAGLPVPHAMLISTIIVFLIMNKELSKQTKAFFEGLGFAFTNVISLIITASCFITGLEAVGLLKSLVSSISSSGITGKLISTVFPLMLGILSGSGTAPSVGFSQAVLPEISKLSQTGAIDLGIMGAIGATFGRTMSPVAAVVIFTSVLLNIKPLQIVKRTAPPLLIGLAAMFVYMLFKS